MYEVNINKHVKQYKQYVPGLHESKISVRLYHYSVDNCMRFLWLPSESTTKEMPSDKRNLFSHSSGGQESETVMLARLNPSDGTEGVSSRPLS